LDGKVVIVNAGDPTVIVPPRVVHSIRAFKGERLVIQEEADPPGNYKVM
jgi:mannose-6-phosphate isomerase-like protein (cupin superfamily)